MYTEEERFIFRYYAGAEAGPRFADPLEALDRLVIATGAGLNDLIEQWNGEAPAPEAQAKLELAAAAREVFGLEPFDPQTGQGTTHGHALAVLREFLEFLDTSKKKPDESPTTPFGSAPPDAHATTSTLADC